MIAPRIWNDCVLVFFIYFSCRLQFSLHCSFHIVSFRLSWPVIVMFYSNICVNCSFFSRIHAIIFGVIFVQLHKILWCVKCMHANSGWIHKFVVIYLAYMTPFKSKESKRHDCRQSINTVSNKGANFLFSTSQKCKSPSKWLPTSRRLQQTI